MDANRTGRFIAQLRKEKGYTQKELAERLMVTDKAISRWETGKGLPDTALLKPLGDLLGVSVGELLSGSRIEETQIKDRTDQIILDALKYSGRMFAQMVNLVLILIGIPLLLSPLFLAGRTYHWMAGIGLMGIAAVRIYLKKKGKTVELGDKALYTVSIAFLFTALLLELLPLSAVLVFAAGPDKRVRHTYSYFDLTLVGYGNFAPLITGILTALAVLMGLAALWRYGKTKTCKSAVFVCSVIAAAVSLVPLLLFGSAYMTAISYLITVLMVLSICFQAIANRNT